MRKLKNKVISEKNTTLLSADELQKLVEHAHKELKKNTMPEIELGDLLKIEGNFHFARRAIIQKIKEKELQVTEIWHKVNEPTTKGNPQVVHERIWKKD